MRGASGTGKTGSFCHLAPISTESSQLNIPTVFIWGMGIWAIGVVADASREIAILDELDGNEKQSHHESKGTYYSVHEPSIVCIRTPSLHGLASIRRDDVYRLYRAWCLPPWRIAFIFAYALSTSQRLRECRLAGGVCFH